MWSLSADIHHLNHGSFGAVPIPVQAAQTRWKERWEEATTRFISVEYQPALDEARRAVAGFVGASEEGLAFIRNTTTGIAGVVRSIETWFNPGDEILTTTQAYNAVRQTLEFTAGRTGARVVAVEIPLQISGPGEVTSRILDAVTDRTRVAVIDHISSPTGQVFPIGEIVSNLEPAVPVIVDGAHAPGQVPLSIDALGASWYAGNLHKWVCAPRGAGFLVTRSDRIDETYPVVISHGWSAPPGPQRYRALFDWLGTDDPSACLSAPDAIRVVASLEPDGWEGVMARNHNLVMAAREVLCDALGVEPPYPESMVGSMAAIPLPDRSGEPSADFISPMSMELLSAGFEVPVSFWPAWPTQVARISAHHYNTLDEYRRLADFLTGSPARESQKAATTTGT